MWWYRLRGRWRRRSRGGLDRLYLVRKRCHCKSSRADLWCRRVCRHLLRLIEGPYFFEKKQTPWISSYEKNPCGNPWNCRTKSYIDSTGIAAQEIILTQSISSSFPSTSTLPSKSLLPKLFPLYSSSNLRFLTPSSLSLVHGLIGFGYGCLVMGLLVRLMEGFQCDWSGRGYASPCQWWGLCVETKGSRPSIYFIFKIVRFIKLYQITLLFPSKLSISVRNN